ncbi:Flavin prenyltransferase UbiX [hydrothermal vent metagenome]|uniref:flavin prenyltransferase n=1 Tax=hydrothermal vent metagenome TaxID=652676 RepID=A0A3B1B206_9ZZZZ
MNRTTGEHRPVILAMTGASGAAYGLRLLDCLVRAERPVYFLLSKAAQIVLAMETDLDIPSKPVQMQDWLRKQYAARPGQIQVLGRDQWTAPVASGSHNAEHMVVCPCTTGSLAAIANGNSDNLIERAADVMIKERRELIMVVRETPLSSIHLENMLKLSRIGVTIMPANPGFYHKPASIDDMVDFIVARILDHLQVPHTLVDRWGLGDETFF